MTGIEISRYLYGRYVFPVPFQRLSHIRRKNRKHYNRKEDRMYYPICVGKTFKVKVVRGSTPPLKTLARADLICLGVIQPVSKKQRLL